MEENGGSRLNVGVKILFIMGDSYYVGEVSIYNAEKVLTWLGGDSDKPENLTEAFQILDKVDEAVSVLDLGNRLISMEIITSLYIGPQIPKLSTICSASLNVLESIDILQKISLLENEKI